MLSSLDSITLSFWCSFSLVNSFHPSFMVLLKLGECQQLPASLLLQVSISTLRAHVSSLPSGSLLWALLSPLPTVWATYGHFPPSLLSLQTSYKSQAIIFDLLASIWHCTLIPPCDNTLYSDTTWRVMFTTLKKLNRPLNHLISYLK